MVGHVSQAVAVACGPNVGWDGWTDCRVEGGLEGLSAGRVEGGVSCLAEQLAVAAELVEVCTRVFEEAICAIESL